MWERIWRELLVEYYWWKRHSAQKRNTDSPSYRKGILTILSGLFILSILGQGLSTFYRNLIPAVNGAQIAETYWSSVFFALKMSLGIFILLVLLLVFLIRKFFH